MHKFIQQVYTNAIDNINTSNGIENAYEKIKALSNYLNIKTYFIPFSSELNNLDGDWRIFLNKNQSQSKSWQDFGNLVGIYYEEVYQKKRISKETIHFIKENSYFAYYFCIPEFMLNNVLILTMNSNSKDEIELIANTFSVDKSFAEKRLSLYRELK